MEFSCHHRDRPDSLALREEPREEHRSYRDGYDARVIAPGPAFAADGVTPSGSVHVLDLPDPAAARAFAFEEPGHQAGVQRDVLPRRWRNTLGRTMAEFPGGPAGADRYLVLGPGPFVWITPDSRGPARTPPSRCTAGRPAAGGDKEPPHTPERVRRRSHRRPRSVCHVRKRCSVVRRQRATAHQRHPWRTPRWTLVSTCSAPRSRARSCDTSIRWARSSVTRRSRPPHRNS
ncbi:YciI family protein [Streptomyces sp. AD55]|uniref:YciI family protein n=1 Tax=Streptomyces sp. AD55 TaxID=3242895 RepID=UPI0035273896